MNPQLLQEIGLTKSQAKAYLALVEKGNLTPPEVGALTKESRSNAYMILQKLEELGLVEKLGKAKKVSYQPTSPVALEKLVEERRHESEMIEERVKHFMPQMLSYYSSFTDRPGIRLLQGLEGLKEIYTDTLRTKKDVYFLRTEADAEFMGEDYFQRYKKRRAALGITTHALSQTPISSGTPAEDRANKIIRTWMAPENYNAPVEINVYGDKVAFLVYSHEDIMGVIIQNKHIAESLRQIFKTLEKIND